MTNDRIDLIDNLLNDRGSLQWSELGEDLGQCANVGARQQGNLVELTVVPGSID